MSRIGKLPVNVPNGVTVTVNGQTIKAKGPKGELSFDVMDLCTVAFNDNAVQIQPVDKSKEARSAWGMSRTMVANMVQGVANEFTRELELVGVGYRAQMKGNVLSLALGYSHDVEFPTPAGLTIATPKPTEIIISGIDKQRVGQAAAEIRGFRPPEPYKGKGIKYKNEFIFRKEGKKK
ncbi:MAG: 50S ribosomal protein L6 [Alphaproteobacteria bacterium]|nr:50S ribosomal protein L6 [Alphaproteobacteria bacterium]